MIELVICVGILVFIACVIMLYVWANRKMNKAMSDLFKNSEMAYDRIFEDSGMGCNCKEKKTKDVNIPCSDANEESFRIAFINETKKSAKFSAEKEEVLRRLSVYEQVAIETVQKLDRHIGALEAYAKNAVESLPLEVSKEFIKKHGNPPTSLRLGNGR